MSVRIGVLGGSSPFTSALVDALVEAASGLPAVHLVLFGRDKDRTDLVADYARARFAQFGWQATPVYSVEDCLRDCQIVLHQIRYGGLAGRRIDETLCAEFGVRYDETLGLGALSSLLRTAALMRPIAQAMSHHTGGWVLNLTNPLSAVTTLLSAQYGLRKCLGVCELPVQTATMIAAALGKNIEDLTWAYTGLNHRGFIHDIRLGQLDAFTAFLATLPEAGVAGVSRNQLAALKAIPLKYYRLLQERPPFPATNRADELLKLGDTITQELRRSPCTSPRALRQRDTSWYKEAVVPLIRALTSGYKGDLVASVPDGSDVTPEQQITVDRGEIKPLISRPPAAVDAILKPLIAHERAMVAAARAPTADHIIQALRLDPLIPDPLIPPIADRLSQISQSAFTS
jgi:6-phospho-beta-glucosidase